MVTPMLHQFCCRKNKRNLFFLVIFTIVAAQTRVLAFLSTTTTTSITTATATTTRTTTRTTTFTSSVLWLQHSQQPTVVPQRRKKYPDGSRPSVFCYPSVEKPVAAQEATTTTTRRRWMVHSALLWSVLCCSQQQATAMDTCTTSCYTTIEEASPKVTDRIVFNVRISRQDGTFYVRDDLPDTMENNVFYGQLVLELFGEVAPQTVQRFKSYVTDDNDDDMDHPRPLYGRSIFSALDPASGVLYAGKILGLELIEVSGSPALRYGGRLFPASLWYEKGGDSRVPKRVLLLSHVGKGLLTHRVLDPLPSFGITTRTDTRQLDGTHVVFGRIALEGENSQSAQEFLNIVSALPTYSVDSRRPPQQQQQQQQPQQDSAMDDVAQAVFTAQRTFFRNTAKALGDTRLDKVYEGKLLRRVEVTKAGIL